MAIERHPAAGSDQRLDALRSLGAGTYEETRPPDDLRHVVACLWVRVVRHRGATSRTPIIPDGCSDLIVFDELPPVVAGPDATTRWIDLADGALITGLRLRPGGVRAVFGCPATAILNREVRLSDLVCDAGALHQRLLRAGTVRQRYHVLVQWTRDTLDRTAAPDRVVRLACEALAHDLRADVGTLARRFDWHTRAIRRHFHAACGYGPKHFQRIMRVQRAIRLAHAPVPLRLADLALAAGYADQPHMTRDFRDVTGFTPAQYLPDTRPEFGVWLAEGW